jgi:hypothetical protein
VILVKASDSDFRAFSATCTHLDSIVGWSGTAKYEEPTGSLANFDANREEASFAFERIEQIGGQWSVKIVRDNEITCRKAEGTWPES